MTTLPIPTFGGTFNGNGHTISGLSITQSVSPAGLFGVLQKDAVIKNLNVEGTVTPSGDSENIGGIVGENHGTIESCTFNGSVSGKRSVGGIAGRNLATGIVRACEASGAIFGQSMTGGIVGENLGSIVSCRGRAYVNIESTDPSIDLSDLSLDFSLDLASLSRLDTLNIATDTGGIAGYSSGAIASSTNYAAVGYQHIGYNVGGVVGRSSGQDPRVQQRGRGLRAQGRRRHRRPNGALCAHAGLRQPAARSIQSQTQGARLVSSKQAVNDAEYGSSEISDAPRPASPATSPMHRTRRTT